MLKSATLKRGARSFHFTFIPEPYTGLPGGRTWWRVDEGAGAKFGIQKIARPMYANAVQT